jgi:hypothetical protein
MEADGAQQRRCGVVLLELHRSSRHQDRRPSGAFDVDDDSMDAAVRLSLAHPVAKMALAASAATGVPGWFIAGSIWLGAGLILIVIGLWFVLEAVTYYEQQAPITPYVRGWTIHHFAIAAIVGVALVAGAVAAFVHFVVDAVRLTR